MSTAPNKARVSDETFDDFLSEQGTLESCEQAAIAEICNDLAIQSPFPVGEVQELNR